MHIKQLGTGGYACDTCKRLYNGQALLLAGLTLAAAAFYVRCVRTAEAATSSIGEL
jgi:hypothetical protein